MIKQIESWWLALRHRLSLNTVDGNPTEGRGLVESEPEPDDYVLGGLREAVKPVIQSNRDWTEFLPPPELQKRPFETWACVSFSRNNCIEIMMRKLYSLDVDDSDRFMAKISNTKIGVGNSFKKVFVFI